MSAGLGRRVFQARLALSAEVGYQVPQSAIAKALGTTGTSVGRYEAGLKVPDLEMIERLAAVLRTTPCYLAFGCSHPHVVGDAPAQKARARGRGDGPGGTASADSASTRRRRSAARRCSHVERAATQLRSPACRTRRLVSARAESAAMTGIESTRTRVSTARFSRHSRRVSVR